MKRVFKIGVLGSMGLLVLACAVPIPSGSNFLPSLSVSPSANPSASNNSASPSPLVSSSANPNASNSTVAPQGFTYLGLNADRVLSGSEVKADGKNDLHFVYTHTFAQETELKSIRILQMVNSTPNEAVGWNTLPGRLWVLGVEANGQALNTATKTDLGKKMTGTVKFDLYGSQAGVETIGLTKSGAEYQLAMVLQGATEEIIKLTAKIP